MQRQRRRGRRRRGGGRRIYNLDGVNARGNLRAAPDTSIDKLTRRVRYAFPSFFYRDPARAIRSRVSTAVARQLPLRESRRRTFSEKEKKKNEKILRDAARVAAAVRVIRRFEPSSHRFFFFCHRFYRAINAPFFNRAPRYERRLTTRGSSTSNDARACFGLFNTSVGRFGRPLLAFAALSTLILILLISIHYTPYLQTLSRRN